MRAAGFGGNAESLRPTIGGAQTKLRLESMEKFFCSQGLASPIEPPGAQALHVCGQKSTCGQALFARLPRTAATTSTALADSRA